MWFRPRDGRDGGCRRRGRHGGDGRGALGGWAGLLRNNHRNRTITTVVVETKDGIAMVVALLLASETQHVVVGRRSHVHVGEAGRRRRGSRSDTGSRGGDDTRREVGGR
jgi:hypothetical protein